MPGHRHGGMTHGALARLDGGPAHRQNVRGRAAVHVRVADVESDGSGGGGTRSGRCATCSIEDTPCLVWRGACKNGRSTAHATLVLVRLFGREKHPFFREHAPYIVGFRLDDQFARISPTSPYDVRRDVLA